MRPKDDRIGLRQALLDFIADFSDWDTAADPAYVKASRALVSAAYPAGSPVVLDPFAGGGAIPLEALRVGADVWASDINPVAVLLEKTILEYIPRYGERLADELRMWSTRIKEQAQAALGRFYPADSDGSIPIAYIWARTALCEGPGCGVRVPTLRGMWLSKRSKVGLELTVRERKILFSIKTGMSTKNVGVGTIKRGALVCPVCGHVTPQGSLERQARQRGLPEVLVAVIATHPDSTGRRYRIPNTDDLKAVEEATTELRLRKSSNVGPLSLVPDESITHIQSCTNVVLYGLTTYGHLFSPRQALSLATFARLVREANDHIASVEGDPSFAVALSTCLGLAVDRCADRWSTLCLWDNSRDTVAHTFGRQALPMISDYAEVAPFSGSTGDWASSVEWIEKVITAGAAARMSPGTVTLASATRLPVPDESVDLVCTDPPYYRAVPYADLSDFFFVWLKRTLGGVHPALFGTSRVEQAEEIISSFSRGHVPHKTARWFEANMTGAFTEARRCLNPDGLSIVVFADKTTVGWEATLQALVNAGWTVTASWPIDTEMGTRLQARNSAVLASSVHLVCRPRQPKAGVGDWSSILRELQPRVDAWMRRLSSEGVVGADAIFACLGPAIELYSRFDRVETAAGAHVPLGGRSATGDDYLSYVWAAVARAALRTIFDEAEATGFEADGRLAAVWLWTVGAGQLSASGETATDDEEGVEVDEKGNGVESKAKPGGFVLPFDTARKLAQPLGADLSELGGKPGSAFQVKGATARMLPLTERRKYLFDSDGESSAAAGRGSPQTSLFDDQLVSPGADGVRPGATTLDRVHQAMLLFGEDRADALRRLLVDDGAGDDARFWRLADALSKLYPTNSPEKRWVDGVLARKRMLNL
jgi:adenine-specific DNA methylase